MVLFSVGHLPIVQNRCGSKLVLYGIAPIIINKHTYQYYIENGWQCGSGKQNFSYMY